MGAGSGKQLSFAYGEVSPLLWNKSDSPFFTQALKQAVNGLVRTSGGFSNRPGTVLFKTDVEVPQTDISSTTNGVRIYTYTDTSDGEQFTIIVGKRIPSSTGSTFPQFPEMPIAIYNSKGIKQEIANLSIIYTSATPGADIDLDSVEFKRIKGETLITFSIKPDAGSGSYWEFYKYFMFNPIRNEVVIPGISFILAVLPTASQKIGAPSSASLGTLDTYYLTSGLQPQPVAYKVYQELYDGSEFIWQEAAYNTGMPSSSATNQVRGFSLDDDVGIKQYNVYRAAAAIISSAPVPVGSYGLVARIPADANVVANGDSLITPEISITPPNDTSVEQASLIGNIKKIFYSKERYLIIPAEGIFEQGIVAASKLGSKYYWKRGLAPAEVDAFTFNLDASESENCEIRAVADVENTVMMTSEKTYVIRGNDGGVISYANVNPIEIYSEGIAKNTPPASLANQLFFLNSDRSKIISLRASDANSNSYIPDYVSQYSPHLLKARNFKRMVVTKGVDVIVWCLSAKGNLISITYDETSNVKGFARHDLGGFVEDIAVSKLTNDPLNISPEFSEVAPTITVSIIRDGVRYIETMAVRDDVFLKNFLYADSSVRFGNAINVSNLQLKITASDYGAGNLLTITDTSAQGYFASNPIPVAVDFFKEDGTYLRITINNFTSADTLTGYCDYDIPVSMQNTVIAKFMFPVNEVSGLNHLAGKEVSVYADGIVLSSPLNKATQLPVMTVGMDGVLDLGGVYQWGYVGLPYKYLAETLRLEASDNRTFTDRGKLINRVGVALEASIGGLVTQNPNAELTINNVGYLNYMRDSDMYSAQEPVSDYFEETLPAEWDMFGSVSIIQVDPLPFTLAAVYPKGVIGE